MIGSLNKTHPSMKINLKPYQDLKVAVLQVEYFMRASKISAWMSL